ncbi:MAG: hydroxyacid dehydrogenase [Acidobacteria bacterium RIFCSPLOWO2_02_FULL_60_20]|nr:MAG: hydroxyacid dehydrogenase [Acidobacteria bacterium RIFCSPLOWO2_02_FULL_60_20]
MRIAFFEVNDWEIPHLKEKLSEHETSFQTGKIHETDLKPFQDAEVLSVFIYSQVNATVLASLPRLRLIATRSTGYDHIDLAACKQRGVAVATVPSYGENTVAEHTFALILALSRHIHKSYVRVMQGNLSREGLTGFDLKGKTIGVIGAGRIGLNVVKIARGFGMEVLVTDVRQDTFLAELLNFRYVPVEQLLASSDIITLHAPYSAAMHHFLNRERMALIRKGALLINTSRGGLVDTDALLAALDDGTLAGAGLDVIEGEQYISEEQEMLRSSQPAEVLRQIVRDHILLRRENVVFTPHNAFNSREALLRILDTTVENIRGFLRGAPMNLAG